MPSYIELDKQASFPVASNSGKVILGINTNNVLQLTNSDGQQVTGLPYQVYTALVTQSGGNDFQVQSTGTLVIGRTYRILINPIDSPGYDFTNVGAPSNEVNVFFVATGTIPNSWGSQEGQIDILEYNLGAPEVIVLENTIGNIWWVYDSMGIYSIYSDGLFTVGKTMVQGTTFYTADLDDLLTINSSVDSNSINEIVLNKVSGNNNRIDGYLYSPGVPIEIRVYN
jgi:hypothetical protein